VLPHLGEEADELKGLYRLTGEGRFLGGDLSTPQFVEERLIVPLGGTEAADDPYLQPILLETSILFQELLLSLGVPQRHCDKVLMPKVIVKRFYLPPGIFLLSLLAKQSNCIRLYISIGIFILYDFDVSLI
jgi:hypothetical protein